MKPYLLALVAVTLFGQRVDYPTQIQRGPGDDIRRFQFTVRAAQITSGSLSTSGAKTITLPCPLGVLGANTNHYIRISGGTGTAENVLITGGSCLGDGATGTLSFTTVNTHTGAFTLTSVTAGLQEAFYFATPSDIIIPAGAWTMYGKLTLYGKGGSTVRIRGNGHIASSIVRSSTYPAGDLLVYDSTINNGSLILEDFTVTNANGFDNTSGAGIHLTINQPREAYLHSVNVINGVNPIVIDPQSAASGAGTPILNNVYVSIQAAYINAPYTTGDGITLNVGGAQLINTRSTRDVKSAAGGSGLKIIRSDGIEVAGGYYNGTHGIKVQNNSSYIMNFIYVHDVLFDECYSHGFYVVAGTHNAVFNQVRIQDSHFVTQSGDANGTAIYLGNDLSSVIISGNTISGWYGSGIVLGLTDSAVRGVSVTGNQINNNGRSGTGYGILIPATGSGGSGSYEAHAAIVGNTIGNNIPNYGAATQQVGIYFAGAAGKVRGYTIDGNDLRGNTVLPMVIDANPTLENFVIGSNVGYNDQWAVVSSASISGARAAGLYRNIEVTGTTAITSLTPVWDGRQLTLVKIDAGTIVVGGGGVIPSPAFNLVQYGRCDLVWYVALGGWIIK